MNFIMYGLNMLNDFVRDTACELSGVRSVVMELYYM